MANNPQVYDGPCETMINAFTTLLNSGYIAIYTGTQPAVDGSLTGTLLVEMQFGATAFANAVASGSGGSATANAISNGTAAATGSAGYFALLKSDNSTVVGTGSVGTSGADLNFNSLSIELGALCSCTSFDVTQAQT